MSSYRQRTGHLRVPLDWHEILPVDYTRAPLLKNPEQGQRPGLETEQGHEPAEEHDQGQELAKGQAEDRDQGQGSTVGPVS
ncbi:hypothetical protein, partial [Streptomyces sp. URMC 124]|uniref:hypothetical protein n=1 Tax=Streptomyces sp. URMC 124 TaxID=3423405 RepID=UPI003F534D95